MSKAKSTSTGRAGKRRAADAKKRPTAVAGLDKIRSDKDWAEATVSIKESGGFKVDSINPFVQSTGSRDTVAYVTAALEYLSRVGPKDEGVPTDTTCQFGAHLLMDTLVEALKAANVQSEHEHKVSRARGILDALKGGAR